MNAKSIVLLAGTLIVIAAWLFCSNNPSSESSPDKARADIKLLSSDGDSGAVIIDTVNKNIKILVSYEYGYFIDSVCISIYPGTAIQHTAQPDSEVVVRFGPDDAREDLEISIRFTKSGEKYVQVQAFRRNAGIFTASASARILPLKIGNNPPVFNQNSPKKVYIVKGGDPVSIPVTVSDKDPEDTIKFTYSFEGKTFPRGEKGVLDNGVFHWQPQLGDKGVYYIVFKAADQDTFVQIRTTIALDTPFNTPPEITTKVPTTVRTKSYYEYRPDADDAEGGVLSWQLTGSRPENLFFDSLTGKILWYAQGEIGSVWSMVLVVTDNGTPSQSDSQSISITVANPNLPPVAEMGSIATGSGAPVEIKLSAKDVDDTQLTFVITDPPDSGSTVFKTADIIVYTPKAGFKGVDIIRFVARDAVQSSDTAQVMVYVALENQRPVAIAQQITTQEDSPVTFTLSARDVEAAPLTYSIGRAPMFGLLSGTTAERQYTPNGNFFGTDTFTFVANDGFVASEPAKIIVEVTPVNDAPVAKTFGAPTAVGEAVTFNLTALDPDDSVFIYKFISGPQNGTLDTTRIPRLVYIPNSTFKGVDSIMYRAVDKQGSASVPARIAILVGVENARPVAEKQVVNVNEDREAAITLRGSDAESSTLKFALAMRTKNGTLSLSGAQLVYRPFVNFFGIDTFSFTVEDDVLVSEPAFVSIIVSPVNDLPTGVAQTVTTGRNSSYTITLAAKDVDDTLFTYRIVDSPRHGTLDTSWVKIGRIKYIPASNYTGSDTIRYIALDLSGAESQPTAVVIVVSQENQRPVADPQNVTFVEDEARPIFLTGTDFESSDLIFKISQEPAHGKFETAPPIVSYKTEPDYNGPDTFTFTVDDGNLKSEPARVVITITPVNDPPKAVPLDVPVKLNTPTVITLQAKDPDDAKFTYQVTTVPLHGTIDMGDIGNAKITYNPSTGYRGADTIFYRAFDGALLTGTIAAIAIGVALDNQPPVADPLTVTLREDEPKAFVLTGKDLEGAPLTFSVTTDPKNGRIELSPPNIRYIPNWDWNGTDSLKFTVKDGSITSAPATVLFVVQAVNDPPTANGQTISTAAAATIVTKLTGYDPEGSSLTFAITKGPANGTIDTSGIRSPAGAGVGYTPASNFQGRDTILFVARDYSGLQSAAARLVVEVALDNRRPVADPKQVTTAEDVATSITLSGSDFEGATLVYRISTNPKRGDALLNGKVVSYRPYSNLSGLDTIMYTVNDGLQSSDPARVVITVTAVNDTPVAYQQSLLTVTEDVAKAFTFSGNDADGNALTYSISADPLHGTISGAYPNGVFTPEPNYSGADAFSFTLSDGSLSSNEITVAITVVAVNDTPKAISQSGIPVNEDSVVVVVLAGTDSDNTDLTAALVAGPFHGTATLSGNSVSYRPARHYYGADSLRFTMGDGSLVSPPKTIGFAVSPVNDAPVVGTIADQSIVMGGSFTVLNLDNAVSDTDNADNSITWTASATTNLSVSITARQATVTIVNSEWSGSETVTFTATDPGGLSGTATAQFTVAPNTPPTISAIADRTIQRNGNTGAIAFTIGDAQTSAALLTLTGASSNATLVPVTDIVFGGSGASRIVTVTPAAGNSGSATITVRVNDGIASTEETFVLYVNAPPTANTVAVTISEDAVASITLTGSDPESGPLTYTVTQGPRNGTLTGSAPALTYTPTLNYNGPDSVLFTVTDNAGAVSVPGKFSMSLTPVNDPPVPVAISRSVSSTGSVAFTLQATDPDNDVLVFTKPANSYGSYTIIGTAPGPLTFSDEGTLPTGSAEVLTFTVSDGTVMVTGNVTITITP